MLYELVEDNGYLITDKGKILNKRGKPLSIIIRQGKPSVSLYLTINGEAKRQMIAAHRLVAEKFCKVRPDGCDFVMIKDGDPTNIKPRNLRWCTLAQCKEWGDWGQQKLLGIEKLEKLEIHWKEAAQYNLTSNHAYSIWKAAKDKQDAN